MTSALPYAEVIGDPIAQSKSPAIHRFWLDALAIEGEYRATQVMRAAAGFHRDRAAGIFCREAWDGLGLHSPPNHDIPRLVQDSKAAAILAEIDPNHHSIHGSFLL